jgi:hypothetical protein
MSAATTLIGCLPTGARWSGVSPYMLLLLKTAQGLFVSGEGPAAVVYSIERSCKVGYNYIIQHPYSFMSSFHYPLYSRDAEL